MNDAAPFSLSGVLPMDLSSSSAWNDMEGDDMTRRPDEREQ